ncbi:MAG: glycosyltransferase family 4 protein [Bacteroidales bacterium]|nr:glycosyltransferase family 4 protein [Bacteroidales bacterium]
MGKKYLAELTEILPEKMKILVLSNKLPYPRRDGGSIATLNMMTGLHAAGNQITCLALNTAKHPCPTDQIPGDIREKIRFIGVDCNCSVRPLRLGLNLFFSRTPYIAERFNIPSYRTALTELLRQEIFDIIQLEGPYPGLYLDLIRSLSEAKLVLRAHNVEHLIWERKAIHEGSVLKTWYLNNMARRLKRFELELAHRADMLIPISDYDSAYFRKQGLQIPMLTIPAGLTMEDYPLTELPAEPSIFYIGALDWLPNQEGLNWFIEKVFPLLLSKLPALRFHVAGRNASRQFEKKLNHPNISYHGEVEDAVGFMQAYRVMLAPLLSGSGIRIKILEGMALGRPVVTTSAGIEGIELRDHQLVKVEDDPYRFNSQILRLLNDAHFPDRMLSGARTFVRRNYDTFELSKRLSQFYYTEV